MHFTYYERGFLDLLKPTKTTEEVDVVVAAAVAVAVVVVVFFFSGVFKVPSFTIEYRCTDGKTTDEKETKPRFRLVVRQFTRQCLRNENK